MHQRGMQKESHTGNYDNDYDYDKNNYDINSNDYNNNYNDYDKE
jgi:hypothetical protein